MSLAVNRSRMQSFHAADVGLFPSGSFRQRPSEEITYFIDFSRWLADGSVVSSVAFSTHPSTSPGILIYDIEVLADGSGVLFKVYGGITGTKYSIDITSYISDGQIKVDTITLLIVNNDVRSYNAGTISISIEDFDAIFRAYVASLPTAPGDAGTVWSNDGSPEVSSGDYVGPSGPFVMTIEQFDVLFRAYVSYLPKVPGSRGRAWDNNGSPEISK